MGKKPQYHKSIKLYPHLIANDDGEVLSLADEMSKLREDVHEVQSLVQEYISDDRRSTRSSMVWMILVGNCPRRMMLLVTG